MNRRDLVSSFAALFAAGALPAAAKGAISPLTPVGAPFTPAAFKTAQQQGKRILIHIEASWCPTCKAQRPIIRKLAAEKQNHDVVIFSVDFDRQKNIVRAFHATMQSTLIAFRGPKETMRSVGDTDPESIAMLMDSNLPGAGIKGS
ncbi:MAG: thioredoxin family protein [Hyphomicrobiales bacterium]|nr:thioredoxin family protein [Hyphomicrobiales bacterium]